MLTRLRWPPLSEPTRTDVAVEEVEGLQRVLHGAVDGRGPVVRQAKLGRVAQASSRPRGPGG